MHVLFCMSLYVGGEVLYVGVCRVFLGLYVGKVLNMVFVCRKRALYVGNLTTHVSLCCLFLVI